MGLIREDGAIGGWRDREVLDLGEIEQQRLEVAICVTIMQREKNKLQHTGAIV
jgi:hypothetical protein